MTIICTLSGVLIFLCFSLIFFFEKDHHTKTVSSSLDWTSGRRVETHREPEAETQCSGCDPRLQLVSPVSIGQCLEHLNCYDLFWQRQRERKWFQFYSDFQQYRRVSLPRQFSCEIQPEGKLTFEWESQSKVEVDGSWRDKNNC